MAEPHWAAIEQAGPYLPRLLRKEFEAAVGEAKRREEILRAGIDVERGALREAEARVAELERALDYIASVLGTGECSACKCEGCSFESQEAAETARAALGFASYDAWLGVRGEATGE